MQEALARTRCAIADTEEILASTQEMKPADDATDDGSASLTKDAMDQIAKNKKAAMEKKRARAASAQAEPPRTSTCAVCHQVVFLDDSGDAQWLPCAHVYHKECIETWASTRNVTLELACPLCKNDNLDAPGFVAADTGGASSSASAAAPARTAGATPQFARAIVVADTAAEAIL